MSQAEGVVKFIRGAATHCSEVPDAELLRRFASARDEQAFRAIVSRYGPVVWSVCRRLVRNHHDAEDAFQATLLVFTRKASELHTATAIGSWLYAVAYRVASRACAARTHFPSLQEGGWGVGQEPADSRSDTLDELTVREAEGALHEELARLPEKFRAPLVLCCLEGLSRDEAATRLGWSANRVKHGLERGREFLRSRLARRGIMLGLPLLTNLLATSAGVASPETIDAVVRHATGTAPPVAISSLANGASRTMWIAKWKWAVAGCVALVLTAGGTLAAVCRDTSEAPTAAPAKPVLVFAPVAATPEEPKVDKVKNRPTQPWDIAAEYLQLIIDGKPEQARKLIDSDMSNRYIREMQVAGPKRVKFVMILMNDSRVMVVTERAKLKRNKDREPTDDHITVTLERKDADSPWRVIENDVVDEKQVMREMGDYREGKFNFKQDPKKDEKEPKEPKPTWELAVEFMKLAQAEKTDEALALTVPGTISENKIREFKKAGFISTKPIAVFINENRIAVAFEQERDDRGRAGHVVLMLVKSKDGGWQAKDIDFDDEERMKRNIEAYLGGKYDTPAKK